MEPDVAANERWKAVVDAICQQLGDTVAALVQALGAGPDALRKANDALAVLGWLDHPTDSQIAEAEDEAKRWREVAREAEETLPAARSAVSQVIGRAKDLLRRVQSSLSEAESGLREALSTSQPGAFESDLEDAANARRDEVRFFQDLCWQLQDELERVGSFVASAEASHAGAVYRGPVGWLGSRRDGGREDPPRTSPARAVQSLGSALPGGDGQPAVAPGAPSWLTPGLGPLGGRLSGG